MLGIGSYTYTWAIGVPTHPPPNPLSALALLEKAAAFGLHVVQFADNLPLAKHSEDELNQLERFANEHRIAIEVGTRGIAPQHLQAYLALAVRFRSPFLRVVIDTAEHHPSPAEVIDTLRPLLPAFEQAGVTLAIENHDRFPVETLIGMIERIGSAYIGICLDTVNSLGCLETPEKVVNALAPYVVNLHVKDFYIRRVDHQMGFIVEGTPAGQGRLDVASVLATLAAHDRRPNAILELWTPPEPTLDATIAKEAAWAEQSIRYLRTVIAD
jgi:3-oxoisoapionate decarboxylase